MFEALRSEAGPAGNDHRGRSQGVHYSPPEWLTLEYFTGSPAGHVPVAAPRPILRPEGGDQRAPGPVLPAAWPAGSGDAQGANPTAACPREPGRERCARPPAWHHHTQPLTKEHLSCP